MLHCIWWRGHRVPRRSCSARLQPVRSDSEHDSASYHPSVVAPSPLDRLESEDAREALGAIGELRDRIEALEPAVVRRARDQGISWQEIARLLRKATSSVFERYRDV